MTSFWRTVAVLPMLALAACAAIAPRSLTVDEAAIQRAVDRRFPLDQRALEVLDLHVAKPRFALLADRRKLGASFDVDVRDRLFGGAWHVGLDLESGLRWDAPARSLRLDQVRVTALRLDGAPSAAHAQAERVGALLAERVLENMPVWHMDDDKAAQLARFGVEPGAVNIGTGGIEISLVPRR